MLEMWSRTWYIATHLVVLLKTSWILECSTRKHIENNVFHTRFHTRTVLHHTTLPKFTYYKSLACRLVNAPRWCIPSKWGTSTLSIINDWYYRIGQTAEMEEMISVANDNPSKFTHTWGCWIHFQDSLTNITTQTISSQCNLSEKHLDPFHTDASSFNPPR